MPIPGNKEPGVLPQEQEQQQSSNFSAAIPLKKRKFPIMPRSPSPPPAPDEGGQSGSDNNDSKKKREDSKNPGQEPSSDAANDAGSSGKSDISKNSELTGTDMVSSDKSAMTKDSILTAINMVPSGKSDMSKKNTVLVVKKEKATDTNVTNLGISASMPQPGNKVNSLMSDKSAGSGIPGNNMGAIGVNVKKEIESPPVEGDCKPNLSIGSRNVELLLGPKEPLVPALDTQYSEEASEQTSDKLDSSLLNLSLYKDALVTREISDGVLNNNVSSRANRSNWDLNTTMDVWEPSDNNNAFLHNNTIGFGKFNSNITRHDLKRSSSAVGTTVCSLNTRKHILHEHGSSLPNLSVQPMHEYKHEDSLCLSLGTPNTKLNSSGDHSSSSAKLESVRLFSNSNLQTGQLSTVNMNSSSCRAVKSEPVDENQKHDCTASTSGTMELSKFSLMRREVTESCSSETAVPSSSSSLQKVVDPRPIKSELFQESNKEISKPVDAFVPQSVENVMQHQESCASSSVLSMPSTPQNSCPSRLPIFSESTTSEDLSNQSEHSFHTKNICNRKDIPDEPIDAVLSKLVSQEGRQISIHCDKVENLNAEDPQRCKLERIDEHPNEFCGNGEIAASDEGKSSIPTDMLESDSSGSDKNCAFANHRGIRKRQRDKDDDYEDGEVREPQMQPTVEDPNVDRKKESVKLVECGTRNLASFGFSCDKTCNTSDFDGKATELENHKETSSNQSKECVDMGSNEPDDKDGALQKSIPDKVTEVGHDEKSSIIVSLEKPLDLSGKKHVEEGEDKEVPGEEATNGSHGTGTTLVEGATDKSIKETSLGKNDSALPKAEASVNNNNNDNNNNVANSSNNATNKSRIINLPRASIAPSPSKTVSAAGRFSSRSVKERFSDLEGEIQPRVNRDEICAEGTKKFRKDWVQHPSLRNSRPRFIPRRGRSSGRFEPVRNDWNSNHEFASEGYNGKGDYQVSRHKHTSSIGDIELDYNGYGITPDNSALNSGRRKALNDELPSLRHPSTRRDSPGGRDGPAIRGIPMHRRIPRNVGPSRCTDEDGSELVGFRHNEKYMRELSDDIMDPIFTRQQPMYDELNDQLVRGSRNFSTVQRKDYSRVRSKSPIRSRTRSPGPWSSPWRRSPDGHHLQLPQHRSPNMYRRMRSPDRACFPNEIVGRRRESPTFMAQPPNDMRDVDSGREHILHRPDNSNRRSPPGRIFPRNIRRVDVLDSRERADGDDYMSGPVHSSRFHDVTSGEERRKFGERRGMARSFRPTAYNGGDNDNFRFHDGNDGPRPFRFRQDGDTDFIERGTMRGREFDGRIKHQPLFVSGRMRNIEDQQDGNHRPSGHLWHDQGGFNDVSRGKRRRF